jgi:RNA polymerase sigma-70 factor (ECF subfamily)
MHPEVPHDVIVRARHDLAAFGQVYDHYLPRIYAFCRKYSASREEAEDLTALTFERALVAIRHYEPSDIPLSRWLLRIAANAMIDQSRRRHIAARVHPALYPITKDQSLEQWEQTHWMRVHLQTLPPDQQEVVRLRFYEDQRFAEVAKHMGRSEGAVKQLLRRALLALHVRIQREIEEDATDE